jgi:hypothetical protein
MSTFSQSTFVDQITVSENGIIFYREASRIFKDGRQVSETFHRFSLIPGQDLFGLDARVVSVAGAVWTAEVVAEFDAKAQAAFAASSSEGAL